MTVLEYLKNIGVEENNMGIKVNDLPNYIEHPVWDSRTGRWLIIKSVVYEQETAKVYATDGSCREVPVGMRETWLWRTEGQ